MFRTYYDFSIIIVCGQWPKDLVITLAVLLLLVLDTVLIYFWGALLSYTSVVHFWFISSRRPRTSPGLVILSFCLFLSFFWLSEISFELVQISQNVVADDVAANISSKTSTFISKGSNVGMHLLLLFCPSIFLCLSVSFGFFKWAILGLFFSLLSSFQYS